MEKKRSQQNVAPPPAAEAPRDALLVFLKQQANIDQLLTSLQFTEHTVLQAASEQPQLFLYAIRARVQTRQQLLRAESHRDEVEARVGRNYREYEESQDKKGRVTDKAVATAVDLSEEVQEARKQVRIAAAKEDAAFLLLEAYRHRRDMIRVVAELSIAEGRSMQSEELRVQELQKLSKEAREARRQFRTAGTD